MKKFLLLMFLPITLLASPCEEKELANIKIELETIQTRLDVIESTIREMVMYIFSENGEIYKKSKEKSEKNH